jgi:hypothetical protein
MCAESSSFEQSKPILAQYSVNHSSHCSCILSLLSYFSVLLNGLLGKVFTPETPLGPAPTSSALDLFGGSAFYLVKKGFQVIFLHQFFSVSLVSLTVMYVVQALEC